MRKKRKAFENLLLPENKNNTEKVFFRSQHFKSLKSAISRLRYGRLSAKSPLHMPAKVSEIAIKIWSAFSPASNDNRIP